MFREEFSEQGKAEDQNIALWKEDDVYISKCPEIEATSVGDSPEEALANLTEATALWLENAKELGIIDDFLPMISASIESSIFVGINALSPWAVLS